MPSGNMGPQGHVPGAAVISVHAVLGFDERPILHCLREALNRGRVDRLVLYQAASGDEQGERRSQEALETLETLLAPLGISLEVHRLKPRELVRNIVKAYDSLQGDLDEQGREAVVCLASGMRLLVIALYTAVLAQPPQHHSRITIYVEPEGKPEERIVYRLSELTGIIAVLSLRDPVQAAIVKTLAERGAATLGEITRMLSEQGVLASRSKVYRALQKLVEEGILAKDEKTGVYRLRA